MRSQAASLDTVARSLILVALAAVGMSIHVGELRETSWRPLAIGFAVALIVGLGSLGAIVTLGLGSAIGPAPAWDEPVLLRCPRGD